MVASLVEQFLEFIDETPKQSVRELSRRVLLRCRALTRAEAGTIFIIRRSGRRRLLEAVAVQNDVIKVSNDTFRFPVDLHSIAGYVASTGETLYIDDAYDIEPDRSYKFNKGFDNASGFRTKSILCFALKSFDNNIVGVVQLINRHCIEGKNPLPFLSEHEQMIAPVNHLVGRALERAIFTERLAAKNETLRKRNIELRQERAEVERLQIETELAFMQSVELLGRAAELHDQDTGNHILRVNEYSQMLAQLAGQSDEFCNHIHSFASLHDVGKMSVDKGVLHKRARLNDEEMQEMQRHTVYGYQILSVSPRLSMGAEIALCHHEKWDGTGYPNGLAGDAIPVAARIVAIADIYDALRSIRPYKVGFDHEHAHAIITQGDDRINPATHFDPKLLQLFAENHGEFAFIWDRLGDHTDAHDRPDAHD